MIPPNAFLHQTGPPSPSALAQALGPALPLWQAASKLLTAAGVDSQTWYSYSPKAGWTLRAQQGKRTIVYLLPSTAAFHASFVYGGKALQALAESTLPPGVKQAAASARRYTEGLSFAIVIETPADLAVLGQLVEIKLAAR